MIATADHARAPHEHALAVVLEGRALAALRVPALAGGNASRWQERPGFGQRSNGRGGQSGRRSRQFQAVIGKEMVTISGDVDERRDEASTCRLTGLLASLQEAYRI